MRKGYQQQKISVIQNISRYLKEPGANEELLGLIAESLEDWGVDM